MDSWVVRTCNVSSGGDLKRAMLFRIGVLAWSASYRATFGLHLAESPFFSSLPRLVPHFSSLGCPLRAFVL